MKLALLNDKIIGHKLEMPIYSSEGTTILNKGFNLTSSIISRLKSMGVGTVYVSDANSEDVVIQELLDSALRHRITKTLSQLFEQASGKKTIDPDVAKNIVKDILESMDVSENSIISFDSVGDKKTDLCIHSLNVTVLSLLLGISSEYNFTQLYDLGVGALLHDIGKLFADDNSHTTEGFKFLREYREFSFSSNICAYSHHENVDGTGYPRGIKNQQIYDYAKIVSICNEYDTLLHSSQNLMPHEVLERISAGVGTKFDDTFYSNFIKTVYCYPNGLTVKLSNGKSGIVIMQNKSFPQRPLIKIIDGKAISYINLMKELNVFIEAVTL